MTGREYHANRGIGHSALCRFGESPEKFKYFCDNPPESSESLVLGQAFHKLVLEPDEFDAEFAVAPECDRRTKDGKALWAAFCEESAGKTVISAADFAVISAMRESVLRNPVAAKLISGSDHEVSYFWTDEASGVDCKCRPDIIGRFGQVRVIADLKSCVCAETAAFARDAVNYGYDVQAYMYKTGVLENTGDDYDFVFIAVEKKPPYAVNVMVSDEQFVARGGRRFRELIAQYAYCQESGNWYGYQGANGEINTLSLPRWAQKEME